ncbi:phage shock protein C (PspC) family protein [Terracoccus luteus]|uniref:Phage shock protein C (PspC) family protein n=1 Tax=Terracoccus luteus TaxID=53356 RepID=A0A495Y0B1_9MICO|nr:ATP-binding protein [Terracoccus luteus]RKT78406.1 phage shock protein C (PspC) family protein [Terracoccus luteus]
MPPTTAPSGPPAVVTPAQLRRTPRPPLLRARDGRVLGGVALGLALHLGVPVRLVRVVLVLTSLPVGAGVAVYVFLWATMRQAPRDTTAGGPAGVGPVAPAPSTAPLPSDPAVAVPSTAGPQVAGPPPVGGTGVTTAPGSADPATPPTGAGDVAGPPASDGRFDVRAVRTWLRSGNEAVVLALLGVAGIVIAGVLWLGSAGLDIRPEVVLPLVAILIGTIFFWSQLDETDAAGARRPVRWIWLVVGLALTTLGLVLLLVGGTDLGELWQVTGAVIAALVGVAVLAAPWMLRLWSRLREEQAARIRATERADIAAHLHDSVLQTLALIQRQSGDSATVARLARAQERQLRSYLYDQDAHPDSLGTALTAAMAEIEDLHGVQVELVVTGDRPMDAHLDTLVKAVREAAWNAVRHASPPITAYVEVGPTQVEAFVRDHGAGFDLDSVPDDRAGVRESIIGRMERHGGSARIRRRADGTEIELLLPVSAPATEGGPAAAPPTTTSHATTPTPSPTPQEQIP